MNIYMVVEGGGMDYIYIYMWLGLGMTAVSQADWARSCRPDMPGRHQRSPAMCRAAVAVEVNVGSTFICKLGVGCP